MFRREQAVDAFQLASEAFRDALRERIRRQAAIVSADLSEEQVERLVAGPDPAPLLFQLAGAGADRRARDAAADIALDRDGMAKIEAGVRAIQELFDDMAALVGAQQDQLDLIEANVSATARYTAAAAGDLVAARDFQRRSRSRQYCLLLVVVLIATVVVAFAVVFSYIPARRS